MKETVQFEKPISVVMPVFNSQVSYLKEAVDSILTQTFKDFEFIIINDGSTGSCKEYLESLSDPRIRIIHNEKNLGITKSLNIGLREARGKYIARMDDDDISLPFRFEKQFAFMESNPDIILCGSKKVTIGKTRPLALLWKHSMTDMEEYRVKLLFVNPGPVHPTAFFRHEKLIKYNIWYDESLRYAQDYGMWETISHYGDVCILGDVLVFKREHADQITIAHREQQIECDKKTQRKLLIELMGTISDEELNLHYIHSAGRHRDAVINPEIVNWYRRIMRANDQRHIYNSRKLKRCIELIEKRLIVQTFTDEMSIIEKVRLVFRYLPFPSAVNAISKSALKKIIRLFRRLTAGVLGSQNRTME